MTKIFLAEFPMDNQSRMRRVQSWLDSFGRCLEAGDTVAAANLFTEGCYWRDFLSFTWNIKTFEGRAAIAEMLDHTLATVRPRNWTVEGEPVPADGVIRAWFRFETGSVWGRGILYLEGDRCRILLTTADDLKGFEQPRNGTRPLGSIHAADPNRLSWGEKWAKEQLELGYRTQPYCLIIGGGHSGLGLGARLRQLGVPSIIVDQNKKIGDSWRNRYRSLVLHDPVFYNHLPYIPFHDSWPIYTPKDKLADWLEAYALAMNLNCWTDTTCVSAAYDESAGAWNVQLVRSGRTIEVQPIQLVIATGSFGPPRKIRIRNQELFKGQLMHSSEYSGGGGHRGKKVAVVGAGSSGHDIAMDLWESGARVSLLQRSPTTVAKASTLLNTGFDLYKHNLASPLAIEDADLISASIPFALYPEQQRRLTREIRQRDAEFYRRLASAGMQLDFGEDDTGLVMKGLRTGGGYYIDVGASDLIIDGKIDVCAHGSIRELTESGILYENGKHIDADAIILCTGYHNMSETIAKIISPQVARSVGDVRGLGSGVKGDPGPWLGEPRNLWKPTAQDGLWLHGGNLAMARFYSKYVALQIKARMESVDTPVYGRPLPGAMRTGL